MEFITICVFITILLLTIVLSFLLGYFMEFLIDEEGFGFFFSWMFICFFFGIAITYIFHVNGII